MSDKRKVTTDALETLGTIIEGGGRDAIHLAVEPVIAAEDLYPGQHIGLDAEGQATNDGVKKLGIVDPFIVGPIPKGKMFWLVVYPRQITSLRHVWEHPDFSEKKSLVTGKPELTEKEKSEQWIKDFADRIRQHPRSLMDAAERWIETDDGNYGGEYTYDNSESYKSHWDGFPEFWKHYEIVTGRKAKKAESFFTCTC